MIRRMVSALAALGALALSGCTSTGSNADLIPLATRPAQAPVPDGDYCQVDGEKGPFKIKSKTDCITIAWNAQDRQYVARNRDEDGRTATYLASVMPFHGLLLTQADVKSAKIAPKEGKDETADSPPFMQNLGVMSGRAFAFLFWDVTSEELDAIVAKHPAIKVEGEGTSRSITSGAPEASLDYLWDLAKASAAGDKIAGGKFDKPNAMNIYVRDKAGAADHPASKAQTADIKAAAAKLKAALKP